MRSALLILSFCIIGAFINNNAHAADSVDNERIARIVKNIGLEKDPADTRANMKILSQNPYIAAGYLIQELRVVDWENRMPPEKWVSRINKHGSVIHVIWCIRTLRYLTGMDMCSKTSYKFDSTDEYENTRQSLLTNGNERDELPFFAEWMSRGSIYIAPADVQQSIIRQWKNWYKNDAKTFKFGTTGDPTQNLDAWYF